MADIDEKTGVETGAEEQPGVSSDAENELQDTQDDVVVDADKKGEPEAKADDEPDKKADDKSDIDFEALLLDDTDESAADKTEAEADKSVKTGTLSERIVALKEIASQLDAVPENQDANFNRLRKLNRELVKAQLDDAEVSSRLSTYGTPEKVEEALELAESLNGYDLTTGSPSAQKFAEVLAAKDPDKAYNAALNLMAQKMADGTPISDVILRKVLQLDPQRIAAFQAISRGETPEGYEGIIAVDEKLQAVNPTFHDAYKRLSPGQRTLVDSGFEQFATPAEKAEAERIMQDSQKVIQEAKTQAANAEQAEATYRTTLETKATEIRSEATKTIGANISTGLDRVQFSSDADVNATMRFAVERAIFDLVNDEPYIRDRADAYFTERGVDMKDVRPKIDFWYKQLVNNADIETVATVKGQKDAAQTAGDNRRAAEARLAGFGRLLAAKVAQKTGAALATISKEKAKEPKDVIPDINADDSASRQGRKPLDWRTTMKATKDGKRLSSGA